MIDTSTIPGSGSELRALEVETTVSAEPLEVWQAWTSKEALQKWWPVPDANIELRIGGPFELMMTMSLPAGLRGSEGCRILSYVPGELLSFTWNAPPTLPLRSSNTWVAITFRPTDEGTRVRLVHTGFLTGTDWDDYLAYFTEAWSYVLDLLSNHWA